MLAKSEAKRAYYAQDMQEWITWWGIEFKFNAVFPLRTVLPLRVTILEPKTMQTIFKAAWARDLNVGDPNVLIKVLNDAGFNGEGLVGRSEEKAVKEQLKLNTVRAKEEGLCGLPTFQINDKELVWGQDKLDLVQDMLCGWKPDALKPKI